MLGYFQTTPLASPALQHPTAPYPPHFTEWDSCTAWVLTTQTDRISSIVVLVVPNGLTTYKGLFSKHLGPFVIKVNERFLIVERMRRICVSQARPNITNVSDPHNTQKN